jgi:hypothetical protein
MNKMAKETKGLLDQYTKLKDFIQNSINNLSDEELAELRMYFDEHQKLNADNNAFLHMMTSGADHTDERLLEEIDPDEFGKHNTLLQDMRWGLAIGGLMSIPGMAGLTLKGLQNAKDWYDNLSDNEKRVIIKHGYTESPFDTWEGDRFMPLRPIDRGGIFDDRNY